MVTFFFIFFLYLSDISQSNGERNGEKEKTKISWCLTDLYEMRMWQAENDRNLKISVSNVLWIGPVSDFFSAIWSHCDFNHAIIDLLKSQQQKGWFFFIFLPEHDNCTIRPIHSLGRAHWHAIRIIRAVCRRLPYWKLSNISMSNRLSVVKPLDMLLYFAFSAWQQQQSRKEWIFCMIFDHSINVNNVHWTWSVSPYSRGALQSERDKQYFSFCGSHPPQI